MPPSPSSAKVEDKVSRHSPFSIVVAAELTRLGFRGERLQKFQSFRLSSRWTDERYVRLRNACWQSSTQRLN